MVSAFALTHHLKTRLSLSQRPKRHVEKEAILIAAQPNTAYEAILLAVVSAFAQHQQISRGREVQRQDCRTTNPARDRNR